MHKETTPCPTIVKLFFFYIYIKTNLDFYLQDDTGTQAIVYIKIAKFFDLLNSGLDLIKIG